MLDPSDCIRCFDLMARATRQNGGFLIIDLLKGGFRAHEVRAYLRLCMARGAVEQFDKHVYPTGAIALRYRCLDDLPPMIISPNDDVRALALAVVKRICRTRREATAMQRQSRLWTSLRVLRNTNPTELAYSASTEDVRISTDQARHYLLQLTAVGYAVKNQDAFRLIAGRNTGPNPVVITRGRAFDLNLMRAVNVTVQPTVQHDGRAA